MRFGAKKTFISSKFYSMLAGGIVTSFFLAFVVMSDSFIAGIMLGADAVIGVNLALPFYSLASFFALMFSLGVPIIYSKEVGAFDRKEADRTFGVGVLGTIVTGVFLFVLLLSVEKIYLDFIGAEGEGLIQARKYLFWINYVALIAPFETLLSGMVFADGDEFLSTIATASSAIGNIIFSILLAPVMGIGGLSFASFFTRAASMLILLIHFFKKKNSLRFNLYFSYAKLKGIIEYSIVDSSTFLFLVIFTFVLGRYISGSFGSSMMILISVVAFIKEIQFAFDGVGVALTPIVSVYLGEKTYPGVSEVWKLARNTAVIESAIVTAMIILGAPLIVRFLGITDPQTVGIAVTGLRMMSLTLVFTSRMYLDSSYYILIDKIPLGVFICALRDVAVAAPLAVIGGQIGGVFGMFIGLTIAPVLGYLLSYLYICIRYDKDSYVLFISPLEKERHIWMYEFEVTPEAVISTRDRIYQTLKDDGKSDKTVNRVMILFEELFMLIYDLNPGKKVLAECIVEAGKGVHIITKDNGIFYDLTDPDNEIGSLRSFVVSCLTENITSKKLNFTSLSFNRNSFEIE